MGNVQNNGAPVAANAANAADPKAILGQLATMLGTLTKTVDGLIKQLGGGAAAPAGGAAPAPGGDKNAVGGGANTAKLGLPPAPPKAPGVKVKVDVQDPNANVDVDVKVGGPQGGGGPKEAFDRTKLTEELRKLVESLDKIMKQLKGEGGGPDDELPKTADPKALADGALKQHPELGGGNENTPNRIALRQKVDDGALKAAGFELKNSKALNDPAHYPLPNVYYAQATEELKKGNKEEARRLVDAGNNTADQQFHDPLVFDLNGDGDTSGTGTQNELSIDGSKGKTAFAAKGDGVLAFGDEPIGTDGGKNKDAMETLMKKAEEIAPGSTADGKLDAGELKQLEAKGLTMMVSSGTGVAEKKAPSELGITEISLKGKAVDKMDSAGNKVTAESSFVRNGKQQTFTDTWFKGM